MSDLKPSHARWIVEMYDYLEQQKRSIPSWFYKAYIAEVVKSVNKVFTRNENSFMNKTSVADLFSWKFFLTEENR